ncbi:hypothetical protein COU57_00950 [Candidatus Pacearchaeota archaeon CG10_big_fil_rev_8_21_14_0_10_32_14]|nr:MAG: hypothetical protein COU57_00950 [Candidatus Pacearchaeota archaeon CG10_big_fil_rev_8_21_14_0_10_32_14]
MTEYLYDTYAIMEIIGGNKNYNDYLGARVIINNFIFAELCFNLFKVKYPDAEIFLNKCKEFIVSIKPEVIKNAMKFRQDNKKKNLSMTDAISYFQSKELGIKFLTGDKEFEHLDNVEFVK